MGLSGKIVALLILLLAANIGMFVSNQWYAEQVRQAQLSEAMQQPSMSSEEPEPNQSERRASGVAGESAVPSVERAEQVASDAAVREAGRDSSPPASEEGAEALTPITICRVFGPFGRALTAAELANRLLQAGAVVDFIEKPGDSEKTAKTYWIQASQEILLQGASLEDMQNSRACD